MCLCVCGGVWGCGGGGGGPVGLAQYYGTGRKECETDLVRWKPRL